MKKLIERVGELIRDEDSRKTFEKVFDESTIEAVHELSTKRQIDHLEFLISVGKEAHVFRAVDASGNFKAVKIYKTDTSEFNRMIDYIEGDFRFKNIGKGKRDIVFAWAKKEFRNLSDFKKAGINVPLVLAVNKNVLVMEFIGTNGKASPAVKNLPFEDSEKFYNSIIDSLAKMVYGAKLVHADLSEYNILNREDEAVIIDCGQSVPLTHPKAMEFFERDLKNMTSYFKKIGIDKTVEEVRKELRKKKE